MNNYSCNSYITILRVVIPSALLLLGCQPEESSVTEDWRVTRTVTFGWADAARTTLQGRVVSDAAFLGSPRHVTRVGDALVVLDAKADSLVHVMELPGGQYIGSWGPQGRAPGELTSAWDHASPPGDERGTWIFDLQQQLLTYFDVAAFLSGEATDEDPELVSLPTGEGREGRTLTVTAMPGGEFVATGFFANGRVRTFDREGDIVSTLGPVPRGKGEETPAEQTPATVRQHAHRGTIRGHPDENRVAIGLRFFDRVELVDLRDTTVTRITGPVGFEPTYFVRQGRSGPVMARTAESRYGYIDIAVTDEYVFGLYSGKSVAEMEDGFDHSHYGRLIVVFDWSGEVRHVIEVDDLLFTIHADAKRSVLYGTRDHPQPAIVEVPIPRLSP